MLEASAISGEVIAARGYFTVETKSEVGKLGFAGVWNWRGTNQSGGKVVLAEWEWVALKDGRQVYIVFDSDVMLKASVHEACSRLAAVLRRKGAEVAFVYLPSAAGGGKVGVD